MSPHVVHILFLTENTQNVSVSRMTSYEILPSFKYISTHHCNTLSPTTLQSSVKRDSHDCHALTQELFSLSCPDFLETHLENQNSEQFINDPI